MSTGDRTVKAVESVGQWQRREHFSCCRCDSMASSCRSLEAKRGGVRVRVRLKQFLSVDPGIELGLTVL